MINSTKLFVKNISIVSERLCYSLAGNSVPLITITGPGDALRVKKREIVIFCARVHPGESNSSWMMHGKNENGSHLRLVF